MKQWRRKNTTKWAASQRRPFLKPNVLTVVTLSFTSSLSLSRSLSLSLSHLHTHKHTLILKRKTLQRRKWAQSSLSLSLSETIYLFLYRSSLSLSFPFCSKQLTETKKTWTLRRKTTKPYAIHKTNSPNVLKIHEEDKKKKQQTKKVTNQPTKHMKTTKNVPRHKQAKNHTYKTQPAMTLLRNAIW